MITQDFYNKVLIQPCVEGADDLKIISGYATSAMAFHHFEELKKNNLKLNISLLVGMCSSDGMSLSNHRGFQNILESEYNRSFKCSYIYKRPPVHSKIYIWSRKGSVVKSFIGSANYTQNAFSTKQREIIAEISDMNVTNYFNDIERDSIYCNHHEVEEQIKIYSDRNYFRRNQFEENIQNGSVLSPHLAGFEHVAVSLLSNKTGDIQNTGGLNWGQREGRNPNQAYIQLQPEVYRTDFFPSRPQHFTVLTDDSKTFICTRAQKKDGGHAIETPHNNSLLGEYFRNRLGLGNGAFVSKSDLEFYGRTTVSFYKFDDENFYMDFSLN